MGNSWSLYNIVQANAKVQAQFYGLPRRTNTDI